MRDDGSYRPCGTLLCLWNVQTIEIVQDQQNRNFWLLNRYKLLSPSTNELRRIAHCQQSNWKKNKFGKIIKMLREEGGLFLKILWSSSFEVSDAETNLSTVDNFSFPKNQFLSHCQSPILQILFTTSLDRHQKQGDRNSWFLKWISVNLKCFFLLCQKQHSTIYRLILQYKAQYINTYLGIGTSTNVIR